MMKKIFFYLQRYLHKKVGLMVILNEILTICLPVTFSLVLTKDSVTATVDAVVYFKIFESVVSVVNVEDVAKSTRLLAATTLRKVLVNRSLKSNNINLI